MIDRNHLRLLLPFWIAALVAGSFLPTGTKQALGTKSGIASSGEPALPHRLWHLASFGSTALLVSLASRTARGRIAGATALLVLGVSIELLQSRLFAAPVEWWDIRDNSYAIIALALSSEFRVVRRAFVRGEP